VVLISNLGEDRGHLLEGEGLIGMGTLRLVPNIALLPCQTQMNFAWQWHKDSMAGVSNVEPNIVEPNSKDKTNHPSSGKIYK